MAKKPASTAKKLINLGAEKLGVTKPRQVTCRFSVNHETWVEVDPANLDDVLVALPVPCYILDPIFSVHDIWTGQYNCGSKVTGKAGVATGTLRHTIPRGVKKTGYDNLGFSAVGFTSNGAPLEKAKVLFLENSRFAKVLV